jgi:hypothetical protein
MKKISTLLLTGMLTVIAAYSQSALKAEFQNRKIKLMWETSDAENLNYYAVERSGNGKRYETVAVIKPAGGGSYLWYDKDSYTGTVYYRVKAVTMSRTFEFVGALIAFQVKEGQKEITIYPDLKNPVTIYADMALLGDNEVSVEITDSEGFVMTNCRPAEIAQSACPVGLSSSLQKVNCTIQAILPGKIIRSRLNIYDTALNFSDAAEGDKTKQALLIR